MKTFNLTLKMLLFVSVLALWSSCSKNEALEDIEIPTPINPPDDDKDDQFMVVCEHVCDVANKVVKYHEASNSITEMAKYINDIKKIKYVDDAYTTSTTMYVKIKDYGVISYSYFPEEETISQEVKKKIQQKKQPQASFQNDESHHQLGLENAVVSVWFQGEKKDRADIIGSALESCGIKHESKDPTINFFHEDIFDYDVVYINTHGMWDPNERLHWLITTDKPTQEEVNIYNSELEKDKLYKFKDIDRDQLSIGFVHEKRNNKNVSVPYFRVSEKYINLSSDKKFKKKGKAIIFISACETLMGGVEITETDQNLRDFSLAKVFEGKDAGAYYGYDESQAYGSIAALLFFTQLASGMSMERAYETIPDVLLHTEDEGDVTLSNGKEVHKKWIADLLHYYSDQNSSIYNSCITQPVLGEMDGNNDEMNYVLKATSPLFRDEVKSYTVNGEIVFFDTTPFRWNFQISKNEDFSALINPQEQYSGSYLNNLVTITQSLSSKDLEAGTTYYYRGFFYDGKEFYYTKTGQFTTKSFGSEGSTTVPDVPGSNF